MIQKTLACSALAVSLAAGMIATAGVASASATAEGQSTVLRAAELASGHVVATSDEKVMYGNGACEMFAELSRLSADGYNGGAQGVSTWSAEHRAWFEAQLEERFGDQWAVMCALDADADFEKSAQARIGWKLAGDGIYVLDPAHAVWNTDAVGVPVYLEYRGDDTRYCSDYLELLSVYDAAKAGYEKDWPASGEAEAVSAAREAVAAAAERIDAENDDYDRLNNRNRVDAISQPEWKFR